MLRSEVIELGVAGLGAFLPLVSPVERIFCPWSLYFPLLQGVRP